MQQQICIYNSYNQPQSFFSVSEVYIIYMFHRDKWLGDDDTAIFGYRVAIYIYTILYIIYNCYFY